MKVLQPKKGFTLIELCIGMAITAMIGGAVATFSLAVSQNWQNEQRNLRLSLGADVIAERIRTTVQTCALLGACQSGSINDSTAVAAVLLWTGDSNGDGLIQGNETAMIYFDPAQHQLLLYKGLTSETATWSYASAFEQLSSLSAYRSGRTSTLLADHVYTCSLASTGNSTDGTSSLSFAFQLSVPSDITNESIVHYGRAALRAPTAIPSN